MKPNKLNFGGGSPARRLLDETNAYYEAFYGLLEIEPKITEASSAVDEMNTSLRKVSEKLQRYADMCDEWAAQFAAHEDAMAKKKAAQGEWDAWVQWHATSGVPRIAGFPTPRCPMRERPVDPETIEVPAKPEPPSDKVKAERMELFDRFLELCGQLTERVRDYAKLCARRDELKAAIALHGSALCQAEGDARRMIANADAAEAAEKDAAKMKLSMMLAKHSEDEEEMARLKATIGED